MAASAAPDAAPPATPEPKGRPIVPIAAGVVAVLIGAVVGMKVIAPRLHHPAAAAEKPAPAKQEAPRLVKFENVIVNPAGTQGQRYLIVSISVEVKTADAENHLHQADDAIRDAMTSTLGQMNMDELTAPAGRDTVRSRMRAIAAHFAQDTAITVYLPQFLIQ